MIDRFALDAEINQLSIGVVLVDEELRIQYYNKTFYDFFRTADQEKRDFYGVDFYRAIRYPVILSGDFAPFHFAREEQRTARSILAYFPNEDKEESLDFSTYNQVALSAQTTVPNKRIRFELLVRQKPYRSKPYYFVEIKDVSDSVQTENIFKTLQTAGSELTALFDQDHATTRQERVDALRAYVKQHMLDILKYNVFEIRTLDPLDPTKKLKPFINAGLTREAAANVLYATSNGNGITGYVATSGEVYICNDTKNDVLYRKGGPNMLSSLTVPLFFCNRVIGVCNVESRLPNAFSQQDAVFLQLYAKDLALAIHLLKSNELENKRKRQAFEEALYRTLGKYFRTISGRIVALKLALNLPLDDDATYPTEFVKLERTLRSMRVAFRDFAITLASGKGETWLAKAYRAMIMKQSETHRVLKHNASENSVEKHNLLNGHSESATLSDVVVSTLKQLHDVKAFLEKAKVLCVMHPFHEHKKLLRSLEIAGATVDVVRSTKVALAMLQSQKYHIIFVDERPDGSYFDDLPEMQSERLDNRGLSVYDIHADGYFLAKVKDPVEKEFRDFVKQAISNHAILDAYFLCLEIEKLKLDYHPMYFLCRTVEEEPTRIYDALTQRRKEHFKNTVWNAPQRVVNLISKGDYFSPILLFDTINEELPIWRDENRENLY